MLFPAHYYIFKKRQGSFLYGIHLVIMGVVIHRSQRELDRNKESARPMINMCVTVDLVRAISASNVGEGRKP